MIQRHTIHKHQSIDLVHGMILTSSLKIFILLIIEAENERKEKLEKEHLLRVIMIH